MAFPVLHAVRRTVEQQDLVASAALGVLPSEYLYYYYRTKRAVENLRQAELARAEAIERMNPELWEELARAGVSHGSAMEIYERYLARRNNSYMAAETTAAPKDRDQLYANRRRL